MALLATHPVFSCSKSTMETPNQYWKFGSKLTIKTPEQRHGRCFGVYIINREYISHFILLFMTLLARARPFL